MKMMGMCLNWKVLIGLAVVGVGIFIFAPQLALSALPFLLLALCPLSMLLMMGSMNNMNSSQEGAACSMGGQGKKNLSHEEQVTQLKVQQAALASQIAALEEGAPGRPAMNPSGSSAVQAS